MNDNDANLELIKNRAKDNVDDVAQEAYNIGWSHGYDDRSKEADPVPVSIQDHRTALLSMPVKDLPSLPDVGVISCPACSRDLTDMALSYDVMEKIGTWTVAQLISWQALQIRSGIDAAELLERTSSGVMRGLGGALVGDVGTIGVNDVNGIFVGIEPDGYTHS